MSLNQCRYAKLSRVSIYRHKAMGKRRRLDEASEESDDSSIQGIVGFGTSQNPGNSDESDSDPVNDEISEDELDFDTPEDHMNLDESAGNMSDSDNSSIYSDANSALSDFDISEIETENEDGNIYYDNNAHNDPLYPGANITIGESLICILKFHLRHNLSDSCLSDLLSLIEIHCPKDNKCARTLYLFRKLLGNFEVPITKHFFCSECFMELENSSDTCNECLDPKSVSYFLSMPLLSQLEELFKRTGFYNSLKYRFERQKQNDCNLEDIYDGRVYRSFCSDEQTVDLRSQSNISFTWNSDGVPLYKSSKFSIWPQFCEINELSPGERKKPSNMLMVGLWFGTKKPDANIFMEPFAEDLQKFEGGIPLYVADLNRNTTVQVITLCSTCDLPAKALFLNMKQYNSTFGCHKCKIQTVAIGRKRAYEQVEHLELRTTEETEGFAREATENKSSVFGVKGPTFMSVILPDFVRHTTIDPMHLLMGISKLLFKIWLLPENRDHEESILDNFQTIRDRISSIAPPSFVERLPRKIDDFAYWKASELIIWLIMYSIPVLNGIMSDEYLSHHKSLVFGIYLLYQESVSQISIEHSRQLLHDYVHDFKQLYGSEFMVCNVHSLLHLADLVQDYGPLWVFTCFPFENANGILKSLVHATRDAQIQICRGVSLYLTLNRLKENHIQNGNMSGAFYRRLEKKGIHRRKLQYVSYGTAIVGRARKFNVIPNEIQQLLLQFGYHQNSIYHFQCLVKEKIFFSSLSYTRKIRTNSSCVEYTTRNEHFIGFVQSFLHVSSCMCRNGFCDRCADTSETLAIIKKCDHRFPFSISSPQMPVNFIHSLEATNETIIINVSQLKAVYCQITDQQTGQVYAIKPFCLQNF